MTRIEVKPTNHNFQDSDRSRMCSTHLEIMYACVDGGIRSVASVDFAYDRETREQVGQTA